METDLIQAISSIVRQHYESSSSPLLLASLGSTLRKSGFWPEKGLPTKNLREFIERGGDSNLHIIRDPNSHARIAVSDEDHVSQVKQQLAQRLKVDSRLDLAKIPRSVLLAFCVNQEPDRPVFLRKTPPHFFLLQAPSVQEASSFWEISPEFRIPNLRLTDSSKLSDLDRTKLEERILSWSADVGVPLSDLQTYRASSRSGTALQRLIDAQSEEIKKKLLIPADIAILLSENE